MNKPKLLLSITTLIVIVLIYAACQKQFNPQPNDSGALIEGARNWFINDIVKKEREMISQPYSVLPSNSTVRKFARMRGLSELLNWNRAKEYNVNGFRFVITPIEQSIKPLSNKNFEALRSLAFYKDQSGKMHMNVVEILSKKGGTLERNVGEVTSIAFANKYFDNNNKIFNVSASIIFYDENYHRQSSFQVKTGSWSKANINLQNRNGAPKKRTVPLMLGRTTCQTCQTYYLVGIWYDLQTGAVVDYEILNQWDECTEMGGPPDGYGTNPEPTGNPPQECIDQNQAALDDLLNSAIPDNTTISIEVSAIDNLTKNKNPKWIVLKSGLNAWKLVSTEKGVVKLVDISQNKWQWESLVHDKISMEGFVAGGEVAIDSENGTPSFTAGTPNILYAGMQLEFTVKYTVSPIPCPPFNMIVPPVYVPYQANAIWPAIP